LILLRILDRLEEVLIASLMAAATFIIFLAVMHRYLIGIPFLYPILFPINLSWAQELCIYMFVWVAKFGAAYGVRTGIHVGVDVVVNQLKSPWRNAVVLFGLFCGAFFTAVVGTMGAKFVIGLMYTDQVSPDLEIVDPREQLQRYRFGWNVGHRVDEGQDRHAERDRDRHARQHQRDQQPEDE